MNKTYFALLVLLELILIIFLRRKPLKESWLDNLILVFAASLGGAAAFVDTHEEFWRLFSGSLLLTGLGLEIVSDEWSGRARLRLSLLFPVIIFSFSTFLSSPLLNAEQVFNMTALLFFLIVMSDLPTFLRERTEVTSAHPLRAMRLLLGGGLAGYYMYTYIPTTRPAEAVDFWRLVFTTAGIGIMFMSFFLRNERRRQLLMTAWIGLFSLWGIFSSVKALQLIGVFLAGAGALCLVLAGDEPLSSKDTKGFILKLGFNALPGTFLFSMVVLYLLARTEKDTLQLTVWFIGLCMQWFAAARDGWDWERAKSTPLTLRHRVGLFIVISGTVIIMLAPELGRVVEFLQ